MSAETIPAAQETPKTNTAEANLVQMRRLLEQERGEKERLMQEKQKLEKEREQFIKPRAPADDDDETDDPYVDSRTLKKKLSSLESKFEGIVERKAEEKARAMIDDERRKSYLKQNADFEQTMQPEVLEKFAQKCPGLAEAILNMPDGFERQKLVYESIKTSGINKKEEGPSTIQQKIDANRKSPYYSPSGVGTAPYATASDYSPSGQKAAYQKLKELKDRLRIG